MKAEDWNAITSEAAATRLNERMAALDAMAAMTNDALLLSGIERIRAMVQTKWKTPSKNARAVREASRRAAQGRTEVTAGNRKKPWTREDETLVADALMTDEDIAVHVGRTLKAVRKKREKLRKLGILKPNLF